jgi:hypothetical protein
LRYYFLDRKKDFTAEERALLVDHVYRMIRWKGLLGFLAKKPIGWDSMLKVYEKGEM